MFVSTPVPPADPLLGLIDAFAADPRAHRIDLGVGVYRDDDGRTPVMAAVRRAEAQRIAAQLSKGYVGAAGDEGFIAALTRLVFGADDAACGSGRVRGVQSVGGSGALRLAAELIRRLRPQARVWLPRPSWCNHTAVFAAAGLDVREYPYLGDGMQTLDFAAMHAALARLGPDDVVVLHGCCHNPGGVDPAPAQWRAIAALARSRGFLPLVDLAYQGFGDGLDADAAGLRLLAAQLDELIVCVSCSKTFGLYRERTGACLVMAAQADDARALRGLLCEAARQQYSMPPAHGAETVRLLLQSEVLTQQWRDELTAMRLRVGSLRRRFAERLVQATGEATFAAIATQRGMFTRLPIDADGVQRLRERHALYVAPDGRINIAGLREATLERAVQACADVLGARSRPSPRVVAAN